MRQITPIRTVIHNGTSFIKNFVYEIIQFTDTEVELSVDNEPIFVDIDDIPKLFTISMNDLIIENILYRSDVLVIDTSDDMEFSRIHDLAKELSRTKNSFKEELIALMDQHNVDLVVDQELDGTMSLSYTKYNKDGKPTGDDVLLYKPSFRSCTYTIDPHYIINQK